MYEIIARINQIMDLEAHQSPDWGKIESLCLETIRLIHDKHITDIVPNRLYQFLDDADIRRKDFRYGKWQRAKVRELLNVDEDR